MIVDFTIKNFRSISDEQLFSMNVETGRHHLPDNYCSVADGKLNVLKIAGIYGANASGKSNVIKAFSALAWIILHSGDLKEDDSIITYEPFLLDENSKNEPISFEMEFIVGSGKRYLYTVSYQKDLITHESLYLYGTRQKSLIFIRDINDDWESIRFGAAYKGGLRKIPFFQNNSYLSKAGNNAASPDMMREIYSYFRRFIHISPNSRFFNINFIKDQEKLSKLAKIMSAVDTGIVDISSEKIETSRQPLFPPDMPDEAKKVILEQHNQKTTYWHNSKQGNLVPFDEDMISDGTGRLFNMMPAILAALVSGGVVLVDEIDANFHSHIVDLIIKLFNDEHVNDKNAQLIFCSHDINIMNPKVFRRDQIWFVEKRAGSSHLYSLDEYDKKYVKTDSPYSHWYDEGRFGALPRINYTKLSNEIISAFETLKVNKAQE